MVKFQLCQCRGKLGECKKWFLATCKCQIKRCFLIQVKFQLCQHRWGRLGKFKKQLLATCKCQIKRSFLIMVKFQLFQHRVRLGKFKKWLLATCKCRIKRSFLIWNFSSVSIVKEGMKNSRSSFLPHTCQVKRSFLIKVQFELCQHWGRLGKFKKLFAEKFVLGRIGSKVKQYIKMWREQLFCFWNFILTADAVIKHVSFQDINIFPVLCGGKIYLFHMVV